MSTLGSWRSVAVALAGLLGALSPGLALAQESLPTAPSQGRYLDRGREAELTPDGSALELSGQRLEGVRVRSGRYRFHAYVGAEAIVQVAPGAPVEATLSSRGLRAVRALMPSVGLWLVRDAGGASGAALAGRLAPEVASRGAILQAVPDLYLLHTSHGIQIPPNDPRYGGQWYLSRIGIEPAWRRVTGSRSVTVVVVDNGCELTHPDLAANLLPGRDVVSRDDDPSPVSTARGANHGTACAGLVAAATDNREGIAGVCPECTLRCVRLLADRATPVPISADVAAMEFAGTSGASVVSNSWGFVEAVPVPGPLATAMEALYDSAREGRGALVVFAAGNDHREITEDELFGVRGVVTVGALNNFDEAAQFSNYGTPVDLTAPTGTLAPDLTGAAGDAPEDYTTTFGGTSSSCPIVSGVAGLLFSAKPDATAREVREALVTSARPAPFAQPDPTGHDPDYGYGVVDPAGALRRLFHEPDPVDAGPPDVGVDVGVDTGLAVPDGATPSPPSPAQEGCGCRAAGEGSRSGWALALASGCALIVTRRRRRARGA